MTNIQKLNQSKLSSESNSCKEIPLTFTLERDFNKSLSFDKIVGSLPSVFKNKAKAIYGKSFGGETFNACGRNFSNLDAGINSIPDSILSNNSVISNSERADFFKIEEMFRLISNDKFSGATNFISLLKSFHSNKSKALPFFIKAEITELASGIIIISFHLDKINFLYFCESPSLIFLPISKAPSSVSFDFNAIERSLAHSDTLSAINAAMTESQLTESSNIFLFKSSEMSILNSVIKDKGNSSIKKFLISKFKSLCWKRKNSFK